MDYDKGGLRSRRLAPYSGEAGFEPMKCPFCHNDNDRVMDSRASQDGYVIRRRRECLSCRKRYTTYERLEELSIKVVKKDHVREPFSREKIRRGLARACWKRPISDAEIDAVVAAVETQVYSEFEHEIDSQSLGMMVMERLKDLDQVAFVRFASVYREFKDVQDFVHELRPMLEQPPKKS
jgi:transcriptional repressor NrdR